MRWFWWFIALIFFLSYSDVFASFVFPPLSEEGGSFHLFFCPQEDCESVLVSVLSSAQKSISCAFFDLDLDSVQSLLDAKYDSGVSVLLVVDNENFFGEKEYLVYDDSKQYMHHKFCVVDDLYVVTGSMNPTFRDAHVNANNLVVFSSPVLAFSFLREFSEIWSGDFGEGRKTYLSSAFVNETLISVYFCPDDACEKKLVSLLSDATSSLYFMTFSFTSDVIGNVLLEKSSTLPVSGIFDPSAGLGSEFSRLSSLSKKYSGDGKLHHKVFIIDERVVVFGSYNPTYRGGYVNDEAMLVVEDATFARAFLDEYFRLEKIS